MIWTHESPPVIVHSENRPICSEDIPMIIQKVKENAKLTEKQFKLLLFLSTRSKGFTPAERLVIRETGISERRLRGVRQKL